MRCQTLNFTQKVVFCENIVVKFVQRKICNIGVCHIRQRGRYVDFICFCFDFFHPKEVSNKKDEQAEEKSK